MGLAANFFQMLLVNFFQTLFSEQIATRHMRTLISTLDISYIVWLKTIPSKVSFYLSSASQPHPF